MQAEGLEKGQKPVVELEWKKQFILLWENGERHEEKELACNLGLEKAGFWKSGKISISQRRKKCSVQTGEDLSKVLRVTST